MTLKKAIELSLIKWEHAKDTGCDEYEEFRWIRGNHEEINKLYSKCGLCEYNMLKRKQHNCFTVFRCNICPLCQKWGQSCSAKKSLYTKWRYADDISTRKELATQIYADILNLQSYVESENIYDKEIKRVQE